MLVLGLPSVVRAGRAAPAQLALLLMLVLEFLLAAGLLRLGAVPTLSALGIVAATVVVRQVIGLALRAAVRGPAPT